MLRVTPESAGFQFLTFEVRRLAAGEQYAAETAGSELAIVMLGGVCSVHSRAGAWPRVGRRENVFAGMPYAVYLPPGTAYEIRADSHCEFALCSCPAEESFPARLIRPADVEIEIRGGGNATRQINKIIQPEFPAQRLLIVEVYTPSGNWSSYPPHKHDVHQPPGEVDLEEIYYYRIDRAEGYAIQRVYTRDKRLDATLTVRDGELVLIPEGYHPVAAAHGYNVYYLNVLAGSARSMAASDDPDYAWVRQTWTDKDPRVPVVRPAEGE
ncbi:MAG: 5-deoxy-glucuronate isomerase [Bryobacteraceae bacterium]|nr:5-deoxy-glucuronate isomerase [Bryobacteraceae bacterium]